MTDEIEITPCTGHCCTFLNVSAWPEEIRFRAAVSREIRVAKANGRDRVLPDIPDYLRAHWEEHLSEPGFQEEVWRVFGEIELLEGMLVYHGETNNNEEAAALGFAWPPEYEGQRSPWYTCKNYDPKASKCLIYDSRPAMCRTYPEGHACRHTGCTRTVEQAPEPTTLEKKASA